MRFSQHGEEKERRGPMSKSGDWREPLFVWMLQVCAIWVSDEGGLKRCAVAVEFHGDGCGDAVARGSL